ncbi:NlpC/P60 family protein [Cyclobacterium lianum]|uniref:NlpC/P60 family protein n=1 Tax=Cyclobacterium lianum TaxID=388280 RepID=A0A1M7IRT1_9BACT|nr:NlpC/P60 family protein [Cyclobacterium lianum]SHM43399.1 NlpC/P60 family protein [Cyclobacterium lianum]
MQNETSNVWLSEPVYGICRLSLLSLYREPVVGSGLTSQLLFGELYKVQRKTRDGLWYFVAGESQAGAGWMLASQHHDLSADSFDVFLQSPLHITTAPISKVIWEKSQVLLLPGSQLHAGNHEFFDWETLFSFEGSSRPFSKKADRTELVNIANTFINAPYLSGGRSIFGLYEGSWMHLVFKIAGYIIPNYLSQLLTSGEEVGLADIQAGDIVVFGNEQGFASRAGLYVGDGQMLAIQGKVRLSPFDPDKWISAENKSKQLQVLHVKNLMGS